MITDEERARRIAAFLAAEANDTPAVWYLSFADESGWLGGCYIEAPGWISAVRETHRLGINPGGEVAADGPAPLGSVPETLMNRLLTRGEVQR